MKLENFWYIACKSKELDNNKPLSRKILNTEMVLFRGEKGKAVALADYCLHRKAQLSLGKVIGGQLQCPYHGWVYGSDGRVTHIPSEGPKVQKGVRCAKQYAIKEQDDYIYVCLQPNLELKLVPFKIPNYKEKYYSSIRLTNRFKNNVTNCVENFVDIPHTTFVHPYIFRNANNKRLEAKVHRCAGSVRVSYKNEQSNFGIFKFFLTGSLEHTDEFFMPNVTKVSYLFGGKKHFNITSQSIPITNEETLVYTDLTYNYGIWNYIAKPIIRRQAQAIIDQDIDILGNQMETIKKYGDEFQNSQCDIIHTYIESIRNEIMQGKDPRELPDKEVKVEFWI